MTKVSLQTNALHICVRRKRDKAPLHEVMEEAEVDAVNRG